MTGTPFGTGDRVEHERYGRGTVECETTGANCSGWRVVVEWDETEPDSPETTAVLPENLTPLLRQ